MTTFTASEVRESAIVVVSRDMEYEAEMLRAFADRLEADEKAEPVMWVDPTTFYGAYPFCIKKLSFMPSDDEDAGVEYVALYTHSAQAQPPAVRVTDEMVMRLKRALPLLCADVQTRMLRAALEAALAAQENPNGNN